MIRQPYLTYVAAVTVLALSACATSPTLTPANQPSATEVAATAGQIVNAACAVYSVTAPSAAIIATISDPKDASTIAAAQSYPTAFCKTPAPTSPASAVESAVWLGQQATQVAVAVAAAKTAK